MEALSRQWGWGQVENGRSKKKKKKSWYHFDKTNEEDVRDTGVPNDAGKSKGRKGCLQKKIIWMFKNILQGTLQ